MQPSTPPALARAFAGLALAAACTQAAAQAGAADARAAVPPTVYQPAFAHRVEAAPDASPDRRWRDSNAVVAATDSMMLTMKAGAHAGHAAAAPAEPGADPHAGHAGHEGHAPPAAMATPAPAAGAMCGARDGGCACCKHMRDKAPAAAPTPGHRHREGA